MGLPIMIGGDPNLQKYLQEISGFEPLSAVEEQRLAKKIQQGDPEARNQLVLSNLRFVVAIAMQYQSRGLPLADLVNEGNCGLIRAAELFDGERGIKFISYAVWWIRQAIRQALAEQPRLVKVPLSQINRIEDCFRVYADLAQRQGAEPDIEAIAREMGTTEEEIAALFEAAKCPVFLDSSLGGDDEDRGSLTYYNYFPDEKYPQPDAEAAERIVGDHILALLEALSEREADVIKLYFGLNDQTPLTLEEIAARYGLTRERIRQIKEVALKRLRYLARQGPLKSHWEDT